MLNCDILSETIAADAHVVWLEQVLQSRIWETTAKKAEYVAISKAARDYEAARSITRATQVAKAELRAAEKQAAVERRVAKSRQRRAATDAARIRISRLHAS